MVSVGIIGASGYTGAELVRILWDHPQVNIELITSRQYAGQPLGDCYPGLGHLPLTFESHESDEVLERAEVYFTALPHKAAMEVVGALIDKGKKVIDLSADFRFGDRATYEAHYVPHTRPDLLDEAAYGLSEIYGVQVAAARLVGNPGCYPTCSLLPLMPLIEAGAIDTDGIVIDAKSGVSGAGRGANMVTHFCEANESVKAYKVGGHRHTPEIEDHLSRAAGEPVGVIFTPHLMPMTRGMLATIYVHPAPGVDRAKVEAIWSEAYAGHPFVRTATGDTLPDTAHVRGTNGCLMAVREIPGSDRMVILSVIDNLAKGASSQAVQNLNLMMGWNPSSGLASAPLLP